MDELFIPLPGLPPGRMMALVPASELHIRMLGRLSSPDLLAAALEVGGAAG